MLSVACLLNDTQLVEDLKTLISYTAFEMASVQETATLREVYNAIRQMGIEVDLKTVATIYADVLPIDEEPFNNMTEINTIVGRDFRNLVFTIAHLPPSMKSKQMANLSIEESVVNKLGQMFYDANSVHTELKSDMLIMRDALLKGASKLAGKLPPKAPTKKEWEQVVNEALAINEMGIPTLHGTVNNMEDLFSAMQEEVEHLIKEINDPLRKAQFEEYMRELRNASYGLMLSKTEAKKMLNDIMKEAGFAKTLANGKTILDWTKLSGYNNSVLDLRNNVEMVLREKNYNGREIGLIKNALEQEFYDLHAQMLKKADAVLTKKSGKAPDRKSDIQKMVELKRLGVFSSAHEKALLKVMGVDSLTRADISTVEDVAKIMDDLSRSVDSETFKGKEFFASYAFRTLQKQINDVITNNINDRTKALQVIRGIDYYFQVKATGLIMNYANLLENNISGAVETMAANLQVLTQMGKEAAFKDFDLWISTFKDVAAGGIPYGTGETRFGDFTQAESSIARKDNILKKALSALMVPARYFLSGSDNAFKAVLTKKAFQLSIHRALVDNGYSKEDATRFINEALYGQNLEQAKAKAKILLEKYNLPATPAAITRLADDLVKANLMTNGVVDFDLIEAAYNSSFRTAAVGLGHEAEKNTLLGMPSRGLKEARNANKRKDAEAIKRGDMQSLAYQKTYGVLFNQMFLFMGGQFNWLQLRLDKTGMGIVTGLMGKWKNDVDYTDKESIEETMYDIRNANQKIYRGAVGLTYGLTITAAMAALFAAFRDDDDKEHGLLAELLRKVNDNPVTKKLFKKSSPEWLLLMYYATNARAADSEDNGSTAAVVGQTLAAYGQDAFNLGDRYSIAGKLAEAGGFYNQAYMKNGKIDEKKLNKAEGNLGEVIGDRTELPLWRPYKSYLQLVTWGNAAGSGYKDADSFTNGVFQGGLIESLGGFKAQRPLTSLNGVGGAKAASLREMGIKDAYQLKRTPNWQELRNADGKRIFNERDKESVEKSLNEW